MVETRAKRDIQAHLNINKSYGHENSRREARSYLRFSLSKRVSAARMIQGVAKSDVLSITEIIGPDQTECPLFYEIDTSDPA